MPLDQYVAKLRAALRARQTGMCIVARTDATTLEEGILRAKRFHEEGADLLLIDGLPSVEALERVGAEVPGHKVINLIYGGKTPLMSARRLHELGFKIVLYSTPALYTVAHTMLGAMRQLKETGELESLSPYSATFREFQDLIQAHYFARPATAGLERPGSRGAVDVFSAEESTRSRLLRRSPAEPVQA